MASINPYWDKTGKANKLKNGLYGTPLIVLTALFAIPAYNFFSGNLNTEAQNKLERKLEVQEKYRKQFQELDKNKDYVIDSTEFIYRNK